MCYFYSKSNNYQLFFVFLQPNRLYINSMGIRERLEGLIKQSGMSKKEFAEKMEAHPGSLNSLLDSPSWPTLQRIAKALDIEVEEIFSFPFVCPHCGKPIKIRIE